MVKKVRSSEGLVRASVDIFEGLKRAMLRRGFIPQRTEFKKSPIDNPPSIKRGKDPVKPTAGEEEGQEKLIDATEKSHEILFKADTVFPFTLFPDTVTLDREKISFATRYFFRIAQVTSIPVRDLLSVEANVGPFFGSVHTSSRFFVTNPKAVNFLWRSDAIKLQRLLQGYIIVHEQKIDCANINKEDLIKLLNDLGQGDTG